MSSVICRWLPRVFGCHCRPERSFHYKGKPFPICARCTGELVGMIGCGATFWLGSPGWALSLVLMLPMVLDGGMQALTRYESGNGRRLVTGILFGYALINLFLLSTSAAFRLGLAWGGQLAG